MQGSLSRYMEKPKTKQTAQPEQQPGPAVAKRKAKGGSTLLAALSSQLVRGGGNGGGGDCAAGAAGSVQQEQQEAAPPLPLQELSLNVQAAAPQQQQQQRESPACHPGGSGPSADHAPALQPCPLCGQLLPVGQPLQRHVEEELLDLEQEEQAEHGGGGPSSSGGVALRHQQQQQPPAWQQHAAAAGGGAPVHHRQQEQQRWQQPPHAQQQQHHQQLSLPGRQLPRPPQCQPRAQPALVLVLGGAPQVTAPTDRRALQRLQRQRLLPAKRPRQPAVAGGFNFYHDGSGAWVGSGMYTLLAQRRLAPFARAAARLPRSTHTTVAARLPACRAARTSGWMGRSMPACSGRAWAPRTSEGGAHLAAVLWTACPSISAFFPPGMRHPLCGPHACTACLAQLLEQAASCNFIRH